MDYVKELRRDVGKRKIILNCAGVMIEKDGEILLQRRSDNGLWGLVGGILELNETYAEAAVREALEETGLQVRLTSFLGIFHNHDMVWANGDAAHVISAMYTAGIVSGEPRIDEESCELRFFGPDEIPDCPVYCDFAKGIAWTAATAAERREFGLMETTYVARALAPGHKLLKEYPMWTVPEAGAVNLFLDYFDGEHCYKANNVLAMDACDREGSKHRWKNTLHGDTENILI